jgi:hypothetical protein
VLSGKTILLHSNAPNNILSLLQLPARLSNNFDKTASIAAMFLSEHPASPIPNALCDRPNQLGGKP